MRIITWVLLAISFIILAVLLISKAAGYRYNPATKKIQKTAFLKVRTQPRDVEIAFGDTRISTRTPWELPHILPGSYELKISKEGYRAIIKYVRFEPSEAKVFDDLILFKENLVILEADADEKKLLIESTNPDDLFFQGGEIFTKDRLITRLSQDVKVASWHPNRNYVAYQVGKEIHVIEVDGSNEIILAKLETAEPAKFVFTNDGKYLIFQSKSSTKKVQILD